MDETTERLVAETDPTDVELLPAGQDAEYIEPAEGVTEVDIETYTEPMDPEVYAYTHEVTR